jgi:hypothetical protein
MSNLLERSHHQQLQVEPGDGRGRYSLERRKARPRALRDDRCTGLLDALWLFADGLCFA